MLEINMRPSGIAWEEQDIALLTPANVVRTNKGEVISLGHGVKIDRKKIEKQLKKPLSKDWLLITQNYYSSGYDINVVHKPADQESYLSIVGMSYRHGSSVLNFAKDCGLIPLTADELSSGYLDGWGRHIVDNARPKVYNTKEIDKIKDISINSEIRIYKNKQIAVLYRVEYKTTGHVRYFTLKPDFYKKNPYSKVPSEFYDEEKLMSNEYVAEITDEGQVYKNSVKCTSRMNIFSLITCEYIGADLLSDHVLSGYSGQWFNETVRDQINTFMGVFSKEEKGAKEMFDSKFLYDKTGGKRYPSEGITNLYFLDRWLTCHQALVKSEKAKAITNYEWWRSLKWGEHDRSVVWERRETEKGPFIICTYINNKTWNKYNAFIYDVKKRTRKVLTSITKDAAEKEVTALIPSLEACILQRFPLKPEYAWDRDYKKYECIDEGPEQTIIGGLTLKELFAQTNVSWILENEKEFKDDLFYLIQDSSRGYYSSERKISTIQDDIKEGGKIGTVALCILATTGDAMLEQLLKSRMFRLYFLALSSKAEGCNVFWDTTKKVRERFDYCPFPYSSKEKNLKKMFGMSLNQLRTADQAVEIVRVEREGYSPSSSFKYSYPKFGGVAKTLGVAEISAIDDALFKEIIDITKNSIEDNIWDYLSNSTSIFAKICARYSNVLEYWENHTPKERIMILKVFPTSEEISKFNDYLGMRKQMQELQAQKPEENIFNAKAYPEKVGKAIKFIRYMSGMKTTSGWYGGHYVTAKIETQELFIDYIKSKYGQYSTEKGSIQLEINEDGKIVGAIVKMNTLQHMNFLHDEMGQWFSLYSDSSTAEKFIEATKRVEKLTWEDDETGLCIKTPDSAAELRDEGAVLSHCVASYVNPIIAGSHNIMFIRRKDMVDEPYYTLDINSKGDVTEVHGYRNCNMEVEDIDNAYAETGREVYNKHCDIKKFLYNWAKAMKGKVNEKSLRGTYRKLDIIE